MTEDTNEPTDVTPEDTPAPAEGELDPKMLDEVSGGAIFYIGLGL